MKSFFKYKIQIDTTLICLEPHIYLWSSLMWVSKKLFIWECYGFWFFAIRNLEKNIVDPW